MNKLLEDAKVKQPRSQKIVQFILMLHSAILETSSSHVGSTTRESNAFTWRFDDSQSCRFGSAWKAGLIFK
jgi:hypothetical protein